jgi:CHASE3 domain sensor protein
VQPTIQKTFKILAPGSSLKRRVVYSLAFVRIILVPVIFLTVYYLFQIVAIVNRIVDKDAPATKLAEQIAVQMLEARRSERNYLLLHDPVYIQENQQATGKIKNLVGQIEDLEPGEQSACQDLLKSLEKYEQQLASAMPLMQRPGGTAAQRIQQAVAEYEKDLNEVLRRSRRMEYAQLVQELQNQAQSFDTELTETFEQENRALAQITAEARITSQRVLDVASQIEVQSWQRVERDQQEARSLSRRAEWVLSIVSAITFLVSVWISFVLPRMVVKPLASLREAVDHAASGNQPIKLELRGEGEIIDLAQSIHKLINREHKAG